jgi:hypothetical protein
MPVSISEPSDGVSVLSSRAGQCYTAVELRTGVFADEETPVLNQSEV